MIYTEVNGHLRTQDIKLVHDVFTNCITVTVIICVMVNCFGICQILMYFHVIIENDRFNCTPLKWEITTYLFFKKKSGA